MVDSILMRDLESLINERIGWVDEELRTVLRPAPAEPAVHEMLRYHLGWTDAAGQPENAVDARRFGGKRLRGALAILACEACGGSGPRAVPVGAAVELIHNFSLIHDDIEDHDQERRHRATVWRVWGIPHAINAGSLMQALVNRAVLRLSERGTPPDGVTDVMRLLTDTIVLMTEGQWMDMSFQDRADVGADAYFAMTERKTAALLAGAMESGARVADVTPERAQLLAGFGRAFGLAFQARDDYLGIWGDPRVTGKPVGSDIERGKRSLPVVLALVRSPNPTALLRQLEQHDTGGVMAAMEALGVQTEVEAAASRLTTEALGYLDTLGEAGDAGRALVSIARAYLGRVQ
jgi:geranylgeranyl diphosphate synthase type I